MLFTLTLLLYDTNEKCCIWWKVMIDLKKKSIYIKSLMRMKQINF
jgi:hypothetical protein